MRCRCTTFLVFATRAQVVLGSGVPFGHRRPHELTVQVHKAGRRENILSSWRRTMLLSKHSKSHLFIIGTPQQFFEAQMLTGICTCRVQWDPRSESMSRTTCSPVAWFQGSLAEVNAISTHAWQCMIVHILPRVYSPIYSEVENCFHSLLPTS